MISLSYNSQHYKYILNIPFITADTILWNQEWVRLHKKSQMNNKKLFVHKCKDRQFQTLASDTASHHQPPAPLGLKTVAVCIHLDLIIKVQLFADMSLHPGSQALYK